jgi:hypothetical protein
VNPELSVHLESGSEVVILEGITGPVEDRSLTATICAVYNAKYRWDLDPDHLPGPFYAVRPRVAFGWLSDISSGGSVFRGTATRWRF